MLDKTTPEISEGAQDYKVNLIAPYEMEPAAFERFQSGFGQVMESVKYSNNRQMLEDMWLNSDRFEKVDRGTAELIRTLTDVEIKLDKKEGTVNMCKAVDEMREDYLRQGREKGREEGREQTSVTLLQNLMESMKMSVEEAMDALKIPASDRPRISALL